MYDIITIGSSLVDSFIKSGEFDLSPDQEGGQDICIPYGLKIEVDEYLLRTGGGGGNCAVGFARMGFRTGVITEIGHDSLAKIVLDDFRKEQVSTNLVVSEKNEHTGGSIILVGRDGGRTVLVHRGAASMLDPEDIPSERIARAGWVHLSSIAGRQNTLEKIFNTLNEANKKLSWNPGKSELKLISEGKVDLKQVPCELFFVNLVEWGMVENKQEEILENFKHVVITVGKKGGRVYSNGEVVEEFTSGEVESKDDTGAGDSFAVGYVTAYLKGRDEEEACQWGKRNAVSVIQQVGAKPGLLTIEQVKRHN